MPPFEDPIGRCPTYQPVCLQGPRTARFDSYSATSVRAQLRAQLPCLATIRLGGRSDGVTLLVPGGCVSPVRMSSPSSRQPEPEPGVTGPESRLSPLPVDQWTEEAKTVLPGYLRRPELYLSGKPDAPPMPQALGLFAHHVGLGAAWMTFTEFLAGERSTLDPALARARHLRAWRGGPARPTSGSSTPASGSELGSAPRSSTRSPTDPPPRSGRPSKGASSKP